MSWNYLFHNSIPQGLSIDSRDIHMSALLGRACRYRLSMCLGLQRKSWDRKAGVCSGKWGNCCPQGTWSQEVQPTLYHTPNLSPSQLWKKLPHLSKKNILCQSEIFLAAMKTENRERKGGKPCWAFYRKDKALAQRWNRKQEYLYLGDEILPDSWRILSTQKPLLPHIPFLLFLELYLLLPIHYFFSLSLSLLSVSYPFLSNFFILLLTSFSFLKKLF